MTHSCRLTICWRSAERMAKVKSEGEERHPRKFLLFTFHSSLFSTEQHPLAVLFHVDAWLTNRKLACEGGIRFQKALNGSVITRSYAPFAVLAHQILLHYYLALSFNWFGESSVKLRIRDRKVAGDAHGANINAIENVAVLRSLQSVGEAITRSAAAG